MKFAASYSGGKESVFAIYEAIKQGHKPELLITTYNRDKNRSHFHGIPQPLLERVSESLGIPLMLVKTSGEEYTSNFEKALAHAKNIGIEACVFGDIDIEGHIQWCSERCENVGLIPMFPLLGRERINVVYDFIDLGFTANITTVNTTFFTAIFLGKQLTKETAAQIAAQGADICGENGEYHTFVSDGPIFRHPVPFTFGDKITQGDYAILPLS
ncbi:MAG: diphthine--ammonia ligase [Firmicutes bacterium]|nr:diphthine--ammonia ligase [Bacillota bacterium]